LPGIVNNRPWHHPAYDPLWEECQRLNVPVVFHGGGADFLTDFGLRLHDVMMMWHTFSHCLGPMSALVSFTAGGVFDRFPHLRAGFLEANCSWAPWLFSRLDDHYEEYIGRFEVKLERKPSEYFKSNCYVSVEPDEAPVSLYVQWFGDDNVVFSTDYPHPDSKFPHSIEKFLKLPLTETTKRKFLWDNCARLYALE
jgi:predicted TIM-barrel fold metal-dependent hydrolase